MTKTVELKFERTVKHSHLYKGKDISGVYIPKTILPNNPPPAVMFITFTDEEPKEST